MRLLDALPTASRTLLERLANIGQALPVMLLGEHAEHLPPLVESGLVLKESTPEGPVALLPLVVRFALSQLGIQARGRLATLLGHLEDLPPSTLTGCQRRWGIDPDPSPIGRATLYRTVLHGWRARLRALPESSSALFATALSGRPLELQQAAGVLFPEFDEGCPGRTLLELGMLIPLTPGLTVRWARVPIELLAEATGQRRRRAFLREQQKRAAMARPWPDRLPGREPFDVLFKRLLLTFRGGVPLERPGTLPEVELGVDPADAALILFFARDRGFYQGGALDLARTLAYLDLPPYERLGQLADYALGLRAWNEQAERPWAEGPCPVPTLRSKLVDQLLLFSPDGVLESDLERLLQDDLPPGRLYHRPAAAVARYLERWGIVETRHTAAGLLVRLSSEHAARLTLRPPYPNRTERIAGWLRVGEEGSFRAGMDAPLDDLLRLLDVSDGGRIDASCLSGRLDRAGMVRGLAAGHSCAELEDTLRRGCEGQLPRRIELLLGETSAGEGAVEIVGAGGVVVFRDRLDMALARQGEVGRLLGREIAPGVLLVPPGSDLGGIRKALVGNGLHASVAG